MGVGGVRTVGWDLSPDAVSSLRSPPRRRSGAGAGVHLHTSGHRRYDSAASSRPHRHDLPRDMHRPPLLPWSTELSHLSMSGFRPRTLSHRGYL